MRKNKIFAILFFTVFIVALAFVVTASAQAEDTVSLSGVQIRIAEPYGVRYIAQVQGKVSDYDEVGMLIVPANKLSGELTLDTAAAKKVSSKSEDFKYFSVSEDSFSYTLCLIGLEHKNYATEFVVRPYAKITTDGQQQTLYYGDYTKYSMSPAKITEKVLEKYADEYTSESAQDYATIDANLTAYNKYLDENTVEEEEPPVLETETVEFLTLNEFYWTIGTLGSTNGVANPSNSKRIFTPGFIPAKDTIITYNSSSNCKYLVMEYDSDKNFLSTSGWITKDYVQKNENAAYYRCAVTKKDDSVLTKNDIASVSSEVTVKVPAVSSGAPITLDFKRGTIAGTTGAINPASTNRVHTPDMYPVEGLVLNYTASANAKNGVTIIGYKEDGSYVGATYGDHRGPVINVEEIAKDAAYVRFVLKLTNITADDNNANELAKCVTASYTKNVNHTFFEIGNINTSGVGDGDANMQFATESENIYTMGYIPVNVSFSFDTVYGGSYDVSYYDSAYGFVSQINNQTLVASPSAPANAAFYRIAYTPGYIVTEASCDYAAEAFSFVEKYTLKTSDWALGTISGTGVVNTSRADRIYTPEFYPTEGLEVTWKANSYSTKYIYIGYDDEKNCIGTSGDRSDASSTAKQFHPTSEYVRLVIKCLGNMTNDTISNVSDNITVKFSNPLLVRSGLEITQEQEIGTFGDEGLAFRIPITSMSSASPGNYNSGMCEVEDEIWIFSTSDKGTAGDGYGVISRYKVDWENKTGEFLGFVKHNFGHANSVDYSSENKCFVVGNGSGSFFNDTNYFYVYYNAYELVKNGAESLEIDDANCITYDWADTGIPKMTKLNTCWYGKNSVLVGCNNNGYVYKVSLGTNDRVLALGNEKENDIGTFNGTWQIIGSYEQTDNYDNAQAAGFRGQGYDQCNQGTDYADGVLYLTCGHDGVYFWRCRLDSDGTIKRDEFHKYMKVGSIVNTGAISGMLCHGDYLAFTNGGYINVYLNSALK